VEASERGLTQALRLPDFRRVWVAEIISDAGSFVTFIALAVYVHDLTGQAFAVGFALALRGIPWITIGPVAGVIVDRVDRRVVMITCDVARALLVVLLPFTHAAWQAYVVSFASGCFSPAFRPARQALLPLIAPGQDYVRALALSEVAHQVMHTIGPALGGAAVLAVGARNAFFLDAASFVISAALIARVKARGASRGRPRSLDDVRDELREGARVLFKDRILRALVVARTLDLLTLGDGAIALMLVYVTSGLGMGSAAYGVALAATGLGTAAGTIVLGRRRAGAPRTLALLGAVLASALSVVLLLRPSYPWLLVLLVCQGVPLAGMVLYVSTFVAERVPDAARGRVFALNGALYEIGDVTGALVLSAIGGAIGAARGIAVGGAAGAIALAIVLGLVVRPLRAADRERAAQAERASGAVLSSDQRAPVPDPE
jgi:NRE family putative nickel resistance protein-like MFS transporter